MILIVFGLPGSGKSYFASKLAAEIPADYVNSDIERKKLPGKRTYTEEEKFLVYDRLLEIMKKAIDENKDIMLDATFYKSSIREKFIKAAGNIPVFFIEVVASEAVSRERLSKKRLDSDADFNVYKKVKGEWEPLQSEHLTLQSTNDNIREMISKAVEYIKKYRP